MLKSLYTTATGMKAQQTMVDTVANNIANVNTAGFKRSQATFEDLLYVTLKSPGLEKNASGTASPIGIQIGSGSRLSGTTKIHTPGTLEGTERRVRRRDRRRRFLLGAVLPDGSTGLHPRRRTSTINADGKLVTSVRQRR